MTHDSLLNGAMELFGFASWPEKSLQGAIVKNVLIEKDSFGGYTLINRQSLKRPYSYQDIYENNKNKDVRIKINVSNTSSFENAKNLMIQNLANCTRCVLEKWKSNEFPFDIGYAVAEPDLTTVDFIVGNTLIEVSCVGIESVDITGFIKALGKQL